EERPNAATTAFSLQCQGSTTGTTTGPVGHVSSQRNPRLPQSLQPPLPLHGQLALGYTHAKLRHYLRFGLVWDHSNPKRKRRAGRTQIMSGNHHRTSAGATAWQSAGGALSSSNANSSKTL